MDQTPKPNPKSAKSTKDENAFKRPAKTVIVAANDHPKRAKKQGTDGDGDEEMKDVKKSGDGEPSAKKFFPRVWRVEDEVTILKGMSEFKSNFGQDPYKSVDAFYDFMKKSLLTEASRNQLKEKIRRLRLKFQKNVKRGKTGEDPMFYKLFDREIFDLSKKVWGNAASVENVKSGRKVGKSPEKGVVSTGDAAPKSELKLKVRSHDSNKDVKTVTVECTDASATDSLTSYLMKVVRVNRLSEDAVKRGLVLIGVSKRNELEANWKEIQVAELELSLSRVELIANYAKLVLAGCKSSNQH